MPLPPSSPDIPEEIEIDRLLLELGIELPAVESLANTVLPAGVNGTLASITDDVESPQEENEVVSVWLPLPFTRTMPGSPESES